ncbi:hypothetical protein ACWFNS_04740 [Oerskovia enterophila]
MPSHPQWDWSPEVFQAGKYAALEVYRLYGFPLELADLEQEAALYIATHEDAIAKRAHRPRYVQRRVFDRLSEYARRECRHKKLMSYDAWAEPFSDEP